MQLWRRSIENCREERVYKCFGRSQSLVDDRVISFDVQPPTSRGNRTRYSQHHSADASERGAEFDVAAQNHGTTGGSNAY